MGPIYAMVYLSGFLNDAYEMIRRGYNEESVRAHLQDGREMLNILTKDWALEKGYKVSGSLIEPGQQLDPYRALSDLERTIRPEDRRTLRVLDSESGKYRDFGFSTYEDAASAQEILKWLEPEPAVGSAIVEAVDMDRPMREWEQFTGKPLRRADDA